jgi:hypothetical protein
MSQHRRLALREDAAGPLTRSRPKPITEHGRLLEATSPGTSGAVRRNVQIITPGWGSSGYYSADVLERAATDKVIPAGTHMYLNHASESERTDRPERDVEKIAAVLVEDASWDGQRLTAPADLMGPHAELIEALAPYIGVSISGSATDITVGEAEGRTGPIIEGLAHVDSVDFVTHAGRGGMVLLEAARPSLVNAAALQHGVSEATVNDTREALQNVLRDTYGGDKTYVWVRDFDETTVWFEVEDADSSGIYGQTYTQADNGSVELTGEWHEVRVVTSYVPVDNNATEKNVPVTRPDSSNPTTEADQEVTMGNIQIDEAEHSSLVEKAGRVDALQQENAALKEAEALRVRRERAAALITESDVTFDDLQVAGLMADLPVKEGALDEDAFKTRVTEAETKVKERNNDTGGQVFGFGASAGGQEAKETTRRTRSAWGRDLTVKGA